jgi:hypothetical protein
MKLYDFDGKPAVFQQTRLFAHEDLPLFSQPESDDWDDTEGCTHDCAECPAAKVCQEK